MSITAYDGVYVRVKFGLVYITGVVSSSLNLEMDQIDATNYESDRNKEYLGGETGGTFSATFHFDASQSFGDQEKNFPGIFDAYKNRTLGTFVYGSSDPGGVVITGSARISSLTWDNSKNEVSECSAEFQITGAISRDVAS